MVWRDTNFSLMSYTQTCYVLIRQPSPPPHTILHTTYNTFLEYAVDLVVIAWHLNNLSMQ